MGVRDNHRRIPVPHVVWAGTVPRHEHVLPGKRVGTWKFRELSSYVGVHARQKEGVLEEGVWMLQEESVLVGLEAERAETGETMERRDVARPTR